MTPPHASGPSLQERHVRRCLIASRRLAVGLRALRAGALVFAAMVAGVSVYAMAARFTYPHELEWMTGAILDHVERVMRGEPLYVAPSTDWIPFIYTPGYYWAAAAVAHLLPLPMACRAVSLLACAFTSACVFMLARQAGAARSYAWLAPILFVACFGYTSDWYDIERSDSLFVAFVAAGALLAQREKLPEVALGGLLVGVSFFVKQPGLTFAAVVPVVLFLAGRARAAVVFAGAAALGLLPLYVALDLASHHWFGFYCVKVPSAHGIAAKFVTLFFVSDLSRGMLLTLATGGAFVEVGRLSRLRREAKAESAARITLHAFVVAGFVASAVSRMHLGGWANVLMFWTTFACPALAAFASRAELALAAPFRGAVPVALALQAGAFVPDPNEAVPGEEHQRFASAFEARVRALEGGGEVVLLGRGHLTAHRHCHINALIDVLRANAPVPEEMLEAARARKWNALILNDVNDVGLAELLGHEISLREPVLRNYFVAERVDVRAPMPVVGFETTPRWIFRPRKVPLTAEPREALERRQRIEMGLAESRMREVQADPALQRDNLDIEALAAER